MFFDKLHFYFSFDKVTFVLRFNEAICLRSETLKTQQKNSWSFCFSTKSYKGKLVKLKCTLFLVRPKNHQMKYSYRSPAFHGSIQSKHRILFAIVVECGINVKENSAYIVGVPIIVEWIYKCFWRFHRQRWFLCRFSMLFSFILQNFLLCYNSNTLFLSLKYLFRNFVIFK